MLTDQAHDTEELHEGVEQSSMRAGSASTQEDGRFFVVGVGASVEGLPGLRTFLERLEPFRGFACVLILRGAADEESFIDELVRGTGLRVFRAVEGMPLVPGNLYYVPLHTLMVVEKGVFHILTPIARECPVDTCLVSLAEAMHERCMAVLFAGTGVDGIRGVNAVKEQGGFALAQDSESAESAGLEISRMLQNICDLVLPPELLAQEVPRYLDEPTSEIGEAVHALNDESQLSKVYKILKHTSKIDFTYYKRATILRRIRRRMALCHIDLLPAYVELLFESPDEAQALSKDILIGVTSFFRDPECFEVLRNAAIIPLLHNTPAEESIRVWVAGCSTGEEAYSVAILFDECQQELGIQREVKIFATDVDTEAVKTASKGIYHESIAHEVSPERLEKYFSRSGNNYYFNKFIRKNCIFAPHNLFVNPPFGQLSLITYRNVLIYFQSILQKTIFTTFHSVLKPEGYLFLGKSEYLCDHMDAFVPVASNEKLFRHNIHGRIPGAILPRTVHSLTAVAPGVDMPKTPSLLQNHDNITDALPQILDALAKACVVVTDQDEVEYLSGAFEPFMRLALGQTSRKLFGLLIPELELAVSTILRQARQELQVITRTGVSLPNGEVCTITAMPLQNRKGHQLSSTAILFSPTESTPHHIETERYEPNQAAMARIAQLEAELHTLKSDLRYNVSELQTVNEELQTSNEEMHTANEELQTSNEELQSVNEELFTVNAEYQQKLEEVMELNDDMANFLSSTLIGIVFVDVTLNIRKFTDYIAKEFKVSTVDIGRPLRSFLYNFEDDGLVDDVYLVGISLMPLQREVRSCNGKSYMLRVSPYRAVNDSIKGLVLSVSDIDELKGAYTQIEKLSYALEQIPIGVTLTTPEGYVEYVNPHFTTVSGYSAEDVLGFKLDEVSPALFSAEEREEAYVSVREGRIWTKDTQCHKKNGELYWERVTLMAVINRNGEMTSFLKLSEDITSQKLAQLSEDQYRGHLEEMVKARTLALEISRNEAQAASKAKTMFLSTVSHEIRTPMNAIMGFTHIFDRSNLTESQKEQLDKIRLSASTLLAVINDVLDISKIEAGKLELQHVPFSLRKTLETVRSIVAVSAQAKSLELGVHVDDNVPDWIVGDVLRLNQIMLNLLNNAIKFTPSGSVRLHVGVEPSTLNTSPSSAQTPLELIFTVTDTGIGIPEEQLSRLFQAFMQADNTISRKYGGTGLGLAISRQLVELMGGSIHVESQPGAGSKFRFTVRLNPAAENEIGPLDTGTDELTGNCDDKLAGLPVLVVEDNLINQEIACALLEEHGIVPARADNGLRALEMAAENRYACIFMDMQMPEMDGLEATSRLRAMGQTSAHRWLATVPIIAMTANAMNEDRLRCLAAGMDDHIAKPIDPELLKRTLYQWLTE